MAPDLAPARNADIPLPAWRCPTCRAPIVLGEVCRASLLGEGAVGKHYVARSSSTPPALGAVTAARNDWRGLHTFVQVVGQSCKGKEQARDLEMQPLHDGDVPSAAEPGGSAAPLKAGGAGLHVLLALERCCPPLSHALLVAAASLHVRRTLDPSLPSLPRAAARAAAALVAALVWSALACVGMRCMMLFCGGWMCEAVVLVLHTALGVSKQCSPLLQPWWAVVSMWTVAGVIAAHEAQRRGMRLLVLALDALARPRALLRVLAAWTAAAAVLTAAVLMVRLLMDACIELVYEPVSGSFVSGHQPPVAEWDYGAPYY
eukprot:scaffold3.g6617.t1